MKGKGYQPFTDLLNETVDSLVSQGVMIRDIASEIGVTTATLSEWRNGNAAPSLQAFIRTCEVFGWPYPPTLKTERPSWDEMLRAVNDTENAWTRHSPSDLRVPVAAAAGM